MFRLISDVLKTFGKSLTSLIFVDLIQRILFSMEHRNPLQETCNFISIYLSLLHFISSQFSSIFQLTSWHELLSFHSFIVSTFNSLFLPLPPFLIHYRSRGNLAGRGIKEIKVKERQVFKRWLYICFQDFIDGTCVYLSVCLSVSVNLSDFFLCGNFMIGFWCTIQQLSYFLSFFVQTTSVLFDVQTIAGFSSSFSCTHRCHFYFYR